MVGPLLRDRKGAHRRSLQKQGIDSRYPTGLKNGKTLAAKRVKRMGDFSTSRRRAAIRCICLALSQ